MADGVWKEVLKASLPDRSHPCRVSGTALFPVLEPLGPRVWEEFPSPLADA